jgi:hypothetical protein
MSEEAESLFHLNQIILKSLKKTPIKGSSTSRLLRNPLQSTAKATDRSHSNRRNQQGNPVFLTEQPTQSSISPLPDLHRSNTSAYLFEEDMKRFKLQRLSETLTKRELLNTSSSVPDIYSRDISHIRDENKVKDRDRQLDQLQRIIGVAKQEESMKLPVDLEDVENMLKEMNESQAIEIETFENSQHSQFLAEIDEVKAKAGHAQQESMINARKEGGLLYKTQAGLIQAHMNSIYNTREKEKTMRPSRIKRSSSEIGNNQFKAEKGVEDETELKNGVDLGAPSNRREAELLGKWLDLMLDKYVNTKTELSDDQRVRAAQLIYTFTLKELVRQVSVHCVERGNLIERILNAQVKMNSNSDDTINLELQNLRKKFKSLISKNKAEYEDKLSLKNKELINLKQELKIANKSIQSLRKEKSQLSSDLSAEQVKMRTLQEDIQKLSTELIINKDKHSASASISPSPVKAPSTILKRSVGTEVDYEFLQLSEFMHNMNELAKKKWVFKPKKPVLMLGYFDLHGNFRKTQIIEKYRRFGKFNVTDFAEELVRIVDYRSESTCTRDDTDVNNYIFITETELNYYKDRAILKENLDDVTIITNLKLHDIKMNHKRECYQKAFNILKYIHISKSDKNKAVQTFWSRCDVQTEMTDSEISENELSRPTRVNSSYPAPRGISSYDYKEHTEHLDRIVKFRPHRLQPEQEIVSPIDNSFSIANKIIEISNSLNNTQGSVSASDRRAAPEIRNTWSIPMSDYTYKEEVSDESSDYSSYEGESNSSEIKSPTVRKVKKRKSKKAKKSSKRSPRRSPRKSTRRSVGNSPRRSPHTSMGNSPIRSPHTSVGNSPRRSHKRSPRKSSKFTKLRSPRSRSKSPGRRSSKIAQKRKIYTQKLMTGVSNLLENTDELKYNLNQLRLRSDLISSDNLKDQIQSCNQLINQTTRTLGENIHIVSKIYDSIGNYVIEEQMAQFEESSFEDDLDNTESLSDYFRTQIPGKVDVKREENMMSDSNIIYEVDEEPGETSKSYYTQESLADFAPQLESFSKRKFKASKEDMLILKLHKKLSKLKKSVLRGIISENTQLIKSDEKLHRRAHKCRIALDELYSFANIHSSSQSSRVFSTSTQTDITGTNLFLNRYFTNTTFNNSDTNIEDELHPVDQIRVIYKNRKSDFSTTEISKRIENAAKLYMIGHKKKHQTSTGLKLLIKTMKELCLPQAPKTIHLRPLMKTINRCYIEKAILYKEEPKSFNSTLPDILYDFLLQTFGLKHVTEDKFRRIICSALYYIDRSKRIRNFLRFLGIESGYSNEDLNFCLNMNEFIHYCTVGPNFSNDDTGLVYFVPYVRAQYAAKTFFEQKLPSELFKKLTSEINSIKIEENRTSPAGFSYKKVVVEKVDIDEFIEILLKYYKLLKKKLHDRISEVIQRTYKPSSAISEPEMHEVLEGISSKLDLDSKFKLFTMYGFRNQDGFPVIRWDSFLSMCVDNESIDLLDLFRPVDRSERSEIKERKESVSSS